MLRFDQGKTDFIQINSREIQPEKLISKRQSLKLQAAECCELLRSRAKIKWVCFINLLLP